MKIKRRAIALLLSMVMVLAFMPVLAFAEEPCTHEYLEYFEADGPYLYYGGNIEYWYCDDCGKYFSDENATTEISEDNIDIEPLLGVENAELYRSDAEKEDDAWTVICQGESAYNAGNYDSAISLVDSGISQCNQLLPKVKADKTKIMQSAEYAALSDSNKETFEEDIDEIIYWLEVFDVNHGRNVRDKAVAAKAAAAENARQGTVVAGLPKVKISKPAAAKKSVTVKWKKLDKKQLKKGVTNIEVWVCPNSAFGPSDTKIVTVGKKKASAKVKGLAKGTYFVKVRAIKNVGGTKQYTAWSKTKKVKVKK